MEYKFTTQNFNAEVLESDLPVLVDFYADWCVPCKMMAPVVAEIAGNFEGKVKVGKCNIEENMEIPCSAYPYFCDFPKRAGSRNQRWFHIKGRTGK